MPALHVRVPPVNPCVMQLLLPSAVPSHCSVPSIIPLPQVCAGALFTVTVMLVAVAVFPLVSVATVLIVCCAFVAVAVSQLMLYGLVVSGEP